MKSSLSATGVENGDDGLGQRGLGGSNALREVGPLVVPRQSPESGKPPGPGARARAAPQELNQADKSRSSLSSQMRIKTKPVLASYEQTSWFQQSLVWGVANQPETMKNQHTLGARRSSNEEPLPPCSCRL